MTDEYYDYLNALRDSGVTNMSGAGAYLQAEFGISRTQARAIVMAWMAQYKPQEAT